MHMEYDRFYKLPGSKVKKLIELALKVREWKASNDAAPMLGALGQIFGAKT